MRSFRFGILAMLLLNAVHLGASIPALADADVSPEQRSSERLDRDTTRGSADKPPSPGKHQSKAAVPVKATEDTPAESPAETPEESPANTFVSLELHGSILSDIAERSNVQPAFGYGLRTGTRWETWGVFGQAEHNLWVTRELGAEVVTGVVNVGLGVEYSFFDQMIRSSLSGGASILTFDTVLDQAGQTGFFIDARPLGIRFPLDQTWLIGVDPITFAILIPVVGSIPLVEIQYRTAVYGEYRWP